MTPPLAGAAEAERLVASLEAALAAGDVACLLLRLDQYSDELLRVAARILAPVAQAKDVAFLIESQFIEVPAIGADGVHLANFDNTGEARRQLGATISIGTTCLSRDDAFSAAERGADYVAFGGFDDPAPTPMTIALVEWWSEIMTVPCVAAGGTTPATCRPLIAAGADFLALAGAAWAGANGPALIHAIMQEIAAARRSWSKNGNNSGPSGQGRVHRKGPACQGHQHPRHPGGRHLGLRPG